VWLSWFLPLKRRRKNEKGFDSFDLRFDVCFRAFCKYGLQAAKHSAGVCCNEGKSRRQTDTALHQQSKLISLPQVRSRMEKSKKGLRR